jgi:hypothetical protein
MQRYRRDRIEAQGGRADDVLGNGALVSGVGSLVAGNTHVFWVTTTGINRAPKDGSGAQEMVAPGGTFDLAVDANHLFWFGDGVLMRAGLDGSGAVPLGTQVGLTDGFSSHIALDADTVYWTNTAVFSVPKLGGSKKTVATGQWLAGVAVDDTNVYFAQTGSSIMNGSVMSASKAGGGAAKSIGGKEYSPEIVRVANGVVYWLDVTSPGGNSIVSTPVAGGPVTTVVSMSVLHTFVVDAAANAIYFTQTCGSCPSPIYRLALP